jgi:hypothetical protein
MSSERRVEVRVYSPDLMLEIMHDYELQQGNDLPPAKKMLVVDGNDVVVVYIEEVDGG